MYDVLGLYPLQQSLVIGSYVKMLVCEVLSDAISNNTRKIPVPIGKEISSHFRVKNGG